MPRGKATTRALPRDTNVPRVLSLLYNTGCNFTFLSCELTYYGKTIEDVIIKLISKMRRDVSVIVLKGQVFKLSILSVITVLL